MSGIHLKPVDVAPNGWEFCGMLNGSHTVDPDGQIEPFDYRDCLTRCDHDIVRLAEALIQLGEKVIRRCPIDKPEVTPDE